MNRAAVDRGCHLAFGQHKDLDKPLMLMGTYLPIVQSTSLAQQLQVEADKVVVLAFLAIKNK